MFAKEVYEERRNKLKSEIGEGIILLPGNGESGMNFRDNTYHFRQDSCFLYFTGISRPDLCLIIDIDNDQEILFGDELTVDDIVWTGALETIEAQAEKAGIAFTRKKTEVINALAGNRKVHFLPVYQSGNFFEIDGLGINRRGFGTVN